MVTGARASDAQRTLRATTATLTTGPPAAAGSRADKHFSSALSSLASTGGGAGNPAYGYDLAGSRHSPSAASAARGRVPAVRGALRQGRLPGGLSRARMSLRLRVRGV